jgi:hypothetical protein
VSKSINLGGARRLQVMADIFNALNANAAVGATSNAGEAAGGDQHDLRIGVAEAAEYPAGALCEVRRAVGVLRTANRRRLNAELAEHAERFLVFLCDLCDLCGLCVLCGS